MTSICLTSCFLQTTDRQSPIVFCVCNEREVLIIDHMKIDRIASALTLSRKRLISFNKNGTADSPPLIKNDERLTTTICE